MNQPTPEQFLATPDTDEDDETETTLLGVDPLISMAESLARIAAGLDLRGPAGPDEQLQQRVADLEAEVTELGTLLDERQAKLDEVLAICKPSTSKLANAIRAALQPPAEESKPETPEPRCAQCGDAFPDVVALQAHGTRAHGAHFDYRDGPVVEPDAPAKLLQPAHDAPVEEWRDYARHCGLDHTADVEKLNKSQIRTALGIPQPVEA